MDTGLKTARGKVAAFLDMGTNSVRLLVVRVDPGGVYTVLNQQREVVRLGEGEFPEQMLQAQAMDRAVLVCRKFNDLARAYGAEDVVAVATSATRDAENQGKFLARLEKEAGLEVRVISGREEARLIYLGVSSGVHMGTKNAVFIDIGGGSTEVIVGNQADHAYLDTLKLGAIRLTQMFFLPDEKGPVPHARYALICQHVRNAAIRTAQRVKEHRIDMALGSSGTIMNLADIAREMKLKGGGGEPRLGRDSLGKVVQTLCSLSLEERRRIPGINPERADILVAGAAIIETLMDLIGLKEIQVSERSLRDGLLVDYLSRPGNFPQMAGLTVRQKSVLRLARTFNLDEEHARTTTRLTLDLFDSAREAGLHAYGAAERELLEHAVFLHDIGMFISFSNHHAHSHYIIRNAEMLGFNQTEISIIACVALFHRKRLPDKKTPDFAGLDKASRQVVRVLSMFVRLAESLDRTHTGLVTEARFKPGKGNRVILEILATGDIQMELWGVQSQEEGFRETFKKGLETRVLSHVTG
jgi:exopolyphosphatase/guanosine-5'-triphosphate,3'-diphosphate pyrophosphatase